MEPESDQEPSEQEENILCVPMDAVAKAQPGDPVSFAVRGTLAHAENGMAYVHVDEVNGKPVLNDAPDSDQEEENPTEDDMRAKAAAADDQETD